MVNENKRDQIISTATNLFSQYGYHAVGIDLIIKDAGVSKKTMYKHFPSKENLIIEVLKQRKTNFSVSLDQKIDFEDDAIRKLELIFEWHISKEFSGCLFAKAAAEFPNKDEEIHKVVLKQKSDLTARIEQILNQLSLSNTPQYIARIIVMLLDGANLSAQITGNTESTSDAWQIVKRLILS
ncbi:TetR/AcrR family transcriptional regulator [Acinetobacter soli]|uniref:TetR family transcriptional regulator n=1 Tax=Acinetobacter soli TaxID=487316 RepID=A0A1P8ENJ8_9GAMM|nr:TetR/AcrR family transcriptional regulator [Acinetobacter soli]APV37749.1 TetR family transcriptional regulator [Acinetobacter soli]